MAVLAVSFISYKIYTNEGSGNYLEQLQIAFLQPGSLILFLFVFLLMLLNWLTEAMKWKYMIGKIEKVKFVTAVEAVLSGLTVSILTPNRIGEYAGRVFHLNAGNRLRATVITIIENSSQLLVTVLAGSIASLVFIKEFIELSPWIYFLIRGMLIVFCLLCLLLYFNLELFERVFNRYRFLARFSDVYHVFSLYSYLELLYVFLLSILRFLIFSFQFYLLLSIYGCDLPVLTSLLMSSITFFVMAVVPTFAIAELGIRGAVSAYFFSKVTIDVLPVLNASFSLWFINLAIPALAGAVLFFHFRLENKQG